MSSQGEFKVFLYWLLFASLILFGLYLSWDLGFLGHILAQDITRISSFIILLFLLTSAHCAYRSWFISRQSIKLSVLKSRHLRLPFSVFGFFPKGSSLAQDYIDGIANKDAEHDKALLAEVLAESLKGSHQVGWFASALVIKLGLLGTVVGFVLMLSSISGIEELDISDIKNLMQQMTQGMGVAMNTTMVGLVSSMLLGGQLLLIDRCADALLIEIIDFGQTVPSGDKSGDLGVKHAPVSA